MDATTVAIARAVVNFRAQTVAADQLTRAQVLLLIVRQ